MRVERRALGQRVDVADAEQRRVVGAERRGGAGLVGTEIGELQLPGAQRHDDADEAVGRRVAAVVPAALTDAELGEAGVVGDTPDAVAEVFVLVGVAHRELRRAELPGALRPAETEAVALGLAGTGRAAFAGGDDQRAVEAAETARQDVFDGVGDTQRRVLRRAGGVGAEGLAHRPGTVDRAEGVGAGDADRGERVHRVPDQLRRHPVAAHAHFAVALVHEADGGAAIPERRVRRAAVGEDGAVQVETGAQAAAQVFLAAHDELAGGVGAADDRVHRTEVTVAHVARGDVERAAQGDLGKCGTGGQPEHAQRAGGPGRTRRQAPGGEREACHVYLSRGSAR